MVVSAFCFVIFPLTPHPKSSKLKTSTLFPMNTVASFPGEKAEKVHINKQSSRRECVYQQQRKDKELNNSQEGESDGKRNEQYKPRYRGTKMNQE
jgi:hypothetical protein